MTWPRSARLGLLVCAGRTCPPFDKQPPFSTSATPQTTNRHPSWRCFVRRSTHSAAVSTRTRPSTSSASHLALVGGA